MEYFEWCEDMNLIPILVVWDGLSLTKKRSAIQGEILEPYIQDVLDQIEVRSSP